jgi:TRAP-type mannitol/chloroaromatic compound transport system permease large subunit
MVCWLFVLGHLLGGVRAGGQELVETWVLSMNLTKTQFWSCLAIIFILGWPLEWTDYRGFSCSHLHPAVGQLWGGPIVLRFAGGAEPFKRPLSPPATWLPST